MPCELLTTEDGETIEIEGGPVPIEIEPWPSYYWVLDEDGEPILTPAGTHVILADPAPECAPDTFGGAITIRFEPPTEVGAADVTDDGYSRQGVPKVGHRLFPRFGGVRRGVSVLKIDGVYRTIDSPTVDQINTATEYYAGGHVYQVTEQTAFDLTEAGYAVG